MPSFAYELDQLQRGLKVRQDRRLEQHLSGVMK
jgi:hypothetical protein